MTLAKTEVIKVQEGNTVIELTGADKEAFIEQRAKDQIEADARQIEADARKQARLTALEKLGLTKEEINAIF